MIKFNDLSYQNNRVKNKLLKSFKNHIEKSLFISGNPVAEFENKFKEINKSKYCISCGNGSDAIFIALKALGVKKGDEVITTSFSWIATSAAITMAGAKIVFCDIEKDSFNIDLDQIKKKITKKTVGIIPVHLYGYPSKIEQILKIAKKNKLWIIEDCAQSHFAKSNKKYVGNFGEFGTFSFFPGKNLGALGDAGCLVTNNKRLANKARLIANHGGKGKHLIEGINSRLDSIQASFLSLKLPYILKDTKERVKNAGIYIKELTNLRQQLKLPIFNKNNVYHQFTIRTKKRNLLQKYLKDNGIQTQVHYKQILPLMKAYKYLKLNRNKFPNSYLASKEILNLPISPDHKRKHINLICRNIRDFFKNN